jgi:hypothetical protein
MTHVWIRAALVCALAFPWFAAQAQTPGSSGDKKVRSGRTVYDFDEVDILGRLKRPEGREIMERPELRFRRLLDLEESFLPNITRAVDEF